MATTSEPPTRKERFGFAFASYEDWIAARDGARRALAAWIVITAAVLAIAYHLDRAGYAGAAAFLVLVLWWPIPPWTLFRVGFSASPAEVEAWLESQRALAAERAAARRWSPITYILSIAFFGVFAAAFWSFFAHSPHWLSGTLAGFVTVIPLAIAWRWARNSGRHRAATPPPSPAAPSAAACASPPPSRAGGSR